MGKLFFGDNLCVMRENILSESVDLVYLDPPFNSKRGYNILFKTPKGHSSDAQITAFEDNWEWGDQAEREYTELLHQGNSDISEMIESMRRFLKETPLMAYLVMMSSRLLELHRVLKPTGSIYLHCDPTASHYLKIIMDTIFGVRHFRNEIVWHYSGWNAKLNDSFNSRHDIILFYGKSDQQKFNSYALPWESEEEYVRIRKQKVHKDEQGARYVMSDAGGGNRVKRFLSEAMGYGKPVDDVWDIDKLNNSSAEKLGYPTQKPLALLDRIVEASSSPGDLVLDPFCGCGTAVHAAQKAGREWIGIDITHLAIALIEFRMKNAFPGIEFEIHGTPKDLDGARDLAERDKYQFQLWACALAGVQPYKGGKKGADTGIDGLDYFQDDTKGAKKIIVSVKGGEHVGRAMIADLKNSVDREKAAIGLFVTLTPPTKPMQTEALSAGYYHSPYYGNFPKIQILTIEGLLSGKERPLYPDLSRGALSFKKAQVEKKKGVQPGLGLGFGLDSED